MIAFGVLLVSVAVTVLYQGETAGQLPEVVQPVTFEIGPLGPPTIWFVVTTGAAVVTVSNATLRGGDVFCVVVVEPQAIALTVRPDTPPGTVMVTGAAFPPEALPPVAVAAMPSTPAWGWWTPLAHVGITLP